MHYHFNYPYYPAAWQEEDNNNNFCVTQGSNGTLYGATTEEPTFGVVKPDETALGQKIYAFTWDATGEFQMRFGDIGNEPVPDTPNILAQGENSTIVLHWSTSELRYIGNNLDVATALIASYVEGEEKCTHLQIVPNQFISYNFNLLRRA